MTTTRAEAWALVEEFTKGDQLKRHMVSVEAAMRAYARHFGADEEHWGIVGLVHDFDYEAFPNEHPQGGLRIMRERGIAEAIALDAYSHGDVGLERDTDCRRAIFAVDEMCGFLIACALVRPDRSVRAVEPASVRRKLKDKTFARGVHRDQLVTGAEALGVPFDEHVVIVRDALSGIAPALGLNP